MKDVKCTLDTMKKVYDILEDYGISGILTGQYTGQDGKTPEELANEAGVTLMLKGGLIDVVNAVLPDNSKDAGSLEVDEAIEYARSFFLKLNSNIQKLMG